MKGNMQNYIPKKLRKWSNFKLITSPVQGKPNNQDAKNYAKELKKEIVSLSASIK